MKSCVKSGEIFLCVWLSQQNLQIQYFPSFYTFNFGFQCLFGQKQLNKKKLLV